MLFDDNRYFAVKAGNVSLKLHNHKDIFYCEDVNALEAIPDYETLIGIEKVDSKETIIEGYYADTMPSDWLKPYEVRIYIRYEEGEIKTPDTKKS
jgi:hypothetical protein